MTKRYFLMAALLGATSVAMAQDTYLNDRLTAVDDLNGTARYVSMGGALGALGADLSVMGSNPAGMALYRKNDVGLTFGVIMPNGNGWDKNDATTYGENLAHASFDQLGMLWSLKCNGKLKYANFGFNYQKKANFNQGFFADNPALGGLSQMDQLAELVNGGYNTSENLAGLAAVPVETDETMDEYYLAKDADGNRYNAFDSRNNAYTRHQVGSLQSYDFNFSFNIMDRVYTGLTIGAENMNYKAWSEYAEWGNDGGLNHSLYNDVQIDGYGVNLKWGLIVRPLAEKSFRIGLAGETPTWYRLDNYTMFNLDKSDQIYSDLEYNVQTPWKVRLSAASTVGSKFAWGVEYEFANYSKTTMGYPKWDDRDPNHSGLSNQKDIYMNLFTKDVLRGQHTLKAGVEYKPMSALALRLGYNYITSRFKDNVSFDQLVLNSRAMDYATSTDYMRLGGVNIFTAGIGYKYKKFYVDMAYKFRMQHGDFYAFDTTGMDHDIAPVDVNLNRHQVMMGLGFKF